MKVIFARPVALIIFGCVSLVACNSQEPTSPQSSPFSIAAKSKFETMISDDPFYRTLRPNRKEAVRIVAQRKLESIEIRKYYASGLDPELKARFHWDQLLTPEEIQFLIAKGIWKQPEWPGYKTYQAQSGIYILIPTHLLQD